MLRVLISLAFLLLVWPCESEGAKYAGEPFRLGAGARPLALGGAYVALADDPSGIYYNPAGLALVEGDQLLLLHSETFGSLINHDFVALSHPARLGDRRGSLGLGMYRVGGGGILLTEWDPVHGRPRVTSEEGHYDYLLLFGGGICFGTDLRVGGAGKVIVRSLATSSAWGLGLDIGVQCGSPEGLALGFSLTDLTSSFLSYDNGTRESILPAARLGASYMRRFSRLALRAVADGEFLFEGRESAAQLSAGKVSLDTHLGGELAYYDLVYFRAGSDIGRLTLGVGLTVRRFSLDGAFMDHKELDNSYRLSLNVAF